jgi:hypothetical protein
MKQKNLKYFKKIGIGRNLKNQYKSTKFNLVSKLKSTRNLNSKDSNKYNSVKNNFELPFNQLPEPLNDNLNQFYSCRNNFVPESKFEFPSSPGNKFENPKHRVQELQNYLKKLRSKKSINIKNCLDKKFYKKTKKNEKKDVNKDHFKKASNQFNKRRNSYCFTL